MNNDKIVTSSFCYILAANFLLFFAFYLILPILPFYLKEEFMIGKSMIGLILSCYTLAALCIRPFAGYLLDTFARRPLYLVAYFIFTAIFGGYMAATALTLFIALRIVHGFAFGMVTVAGNTILIDILPSSRRGEGIGYYGLANNIAMFNIMGEMNPKGKLLNVAFAVSAAFVFGDHLGFTAGNEPEMIFPVILGKLVAGITAVILAYILAPKLLAKIDAATGKAA